MDILKALNLVVRFFLELCMLAAVGYWGFKTHSAWTMKIILGIGLPILIAIAWGMFVSPKAAYPLHGVTHFLVEVILLGTGAITLFASGRPDLGWIYTIILVINEIFLFVWKQ